MSIDTFGHSPSWTHEEMVAAGYVTDDEAQTLTPRGQLRIDLEAVADQLGATPARSLCWEAGAILDRLGGEWTRTHPETLQAFADKLRAAARGAEASSEEGWADVLSCTADTIDPDRRGVGDDPRTPLPPAPEVTP